jgi:hypothetical protein
MSATIATSQPSGISWLDWVLGAALAAVLLAGGVTAWVIKHPRGARAQTSESPLSGCAGTTMGGCGAESGGRRDNDERSVLINLSSFLRHPSWPQRTIPGMVRGDSPESAPAPESAPQSRQSKRRLIQRGVAAVVVLVGGWSVWHQYTAHLEATKTQQLSHSVEQSMQETFDSDPSFSKYHIRVEKVGLIKDSGNTYDGIATVRTLGSSDHDVAIEVTDGGSKVMWQAQPSGFLFLDQKDLDQEDLQAVMTCAQK